MTNKTIGISLVFTFLVICYDKANFPIHVFKKCITLLTTFQLENNPAYNTATSTIAAQVPLVLQTGTFQNWLSDGEYRKYHVTESFSAKQLLP